MSRTVFAGRYTAQVREPLVLFLIGFRINNPLDVRRWFWVLRQMPPMLEVLATHRDKGLLHFETFFTPRGVHVVQYWRSFDDLERFARTSDDPHLQSWRDFNRIIGSHPSSGIWHETYVVEPAQFEGVYANMPSWGMAAATEHVKVGPGRESAKDRLRTRSREASS